jgi:DNA gyrase subunit A
MGRVSRGVTGIRFKAGDRVVGMEVVDPRSEILTVTEKGYGKRTEAEAYRIQRRGGQGTLNLRITEKNGKVVGILQVKEDADVMVVTQNGKTVRTPVQGINRIGRATQGVIVIKMEAGDQVAGLAGLARLKDKD